MWANWFGSWVSSSAKKCMHELKKRVIGRPVSRKQRRSRGHLGSYLCAPNRCGRGPYKTHRQGKARPWGRECGAFQSHPHCKAACPRVLWWPVRASVKLMVSWGAAPCIDGIGAECVRVMRVCLCVGTPVSATRLMVGVCVPRSWQHQQLATLLSQDGVSLGGGTLSCFCTADAPV